MTDLTCGKCSEFQEPQKDGVGQGHCTEFDRPTSPDSNCIHSTLAIRNGVTERIEQYITPADNVVMFSQPRK